MAWLHPVTRLRPPSKWGIKKNEADKEQKDGNYMGGESPALLYSAKNASVKK